MLEVVNLCKNFGSKEILKDINLRVEDGSIFGLVGINGAGKSTLLRCIAAVYRTDKGGAFLDGRETFLDEEIRKDIFFLPDDPYLPPTANLESQMEFYQSFFEFDTEVAEKYIKMLELEKTVPFSNYSKGMKRQACLIFAMAIKPRLIMLDEMFDGLDPLVRLIFKKGIISLVEENGTSVIISSHNLKELEDICDSYGILEDGHVNSYGDLISSKETINKYQVAFKDEKCKEDFKDFDIMHYSTVGTVITMVIRGNSEEIREKLMAMEPILLDDLPVNFEELFIYEMESRGKFYE